MKIEEVIKLLTGAREGSGELDDAIYAAANGYKKVGGGSTRGGGLCEDFWLTGAPDNVICGQVMVGRSPLFTFNLGDARTLVESGMLFSVEGNASHYQQGKYGKAHIWCSQDYSKIESMAAVDITAEGATPEIALCIAALSARIMARQR